jgi:hypothetical protein
MTQNNVLKDFNALPPDAQKQVVDFIAFLKTRYNLTSRGTTASPKKIMDEAFVGIWRNREEMQDSSKWVRNVRESDWR